MKQIIAAIKNLGNLLTTLRMTMASERIFLTAGITVNSTNVDNYLLSSIKQYFSQGIKHNENTSFDVEVVRTGDN